MHRGYTRPDTHRLPQQVKSCHDPHHIAQLYVLKVQTFHDSARCANCPPRRRPPPVSAFEYQREPTEGKMTSPDEEHSALSQRRPRLHLHGDRHAPGVRSAVCICEKWKTDARVTGSLCLPGSEAKA